jgi:hypothetical protein
LINLAETTHDDVMACRCSSVGHRTSLEPKPVNVSTDWRGGPGAIGNLASGCRSTQFTDFSYHRGDNGFTTRVRITPFVAGSLRQPHGDTGATSSTCRPTTSTCCPATKAQDHKFFGSRVQPGPTAGLLIGLGSIELTLKPTRFMGGLSDVDAP